MEKKELKRYLTIGAIAVAVCFIVQHFSLFGKAIAVAFNAAFPMILGLVFAYILNIILIAFEKKCFPKSTGKFANAMRRPLCLVLSLVCVIALIALILLIIIPELINAIKLMGSEIPPVAEKLRDYLLKKLSEYPDLQKQATDLFNEFDLKTLDWASITSKATSFIRGGVVGIVTSALGFVGVVTGAVTNIVLALIFAIYLLLRKDKLLQDLQRFQRVYMGEKLTRRINRLCHVANETFRAFFVGQFVEAIILGSLCFIGMTILKLPYTAMSATLVGVTALIPIVGGLIGAGVSAFMIATTSPTQALVFLIFLIILQQFESNIIYPKVVGNSVGLPGLWVLAAITVGGGLMGVVGMLIGVPMAATVYKLLFERLEHKEAELCTAAKNAPVPEPIKDELPKTVPPKDEAPKIAATENEPKAVKTKNGQSKKNAPKRRKK